MPRVEVLIHRFDRIDAYGWRQNVIQRDDQVALRDGGFQLNGGDLAESMHSGIRASRALGQNVLAGKPLNAFGQSALHGRQSGLNLPAVKFRSVIGQRYFESATHIVPRDCERSIAAL